VVFSLYVFQKTFDLSLRYDSLKIMNLKKLFIIVLTLLFYFGAVSSQSAQEKDMTGKWKTIDDKTGKEKSIVQLWIDEKGNLNGKIIKLFRKPDEDQNPVCDKCEGDKKDAPLSGMVILWDFTPDHKKSNDSWKSGKILDPKTGVEYSCNLKLNESANELEVRGFLGFSMIGRTQTWIRITEENK